MSEKSGAGTWSKEMGEGGRFQRQQSAFRRFVTADGSSGFPAVAGRYHLYVSYACPWASRTIILRKLKGLEDAIGMTVVDPVRDERSWGFKGAGIEHADPDDPAVEVDPLNGWSFLSEGYAATDPDFDGRVTVPVLWDTETGTIVNNESSEILRMLNSEFDAVAAHPERDYYPAELREEIDGLNDWIYPTVNNGVYAAGFATSQEAYEEGVTALFASLDRLEGILATNRYLTGDAITEADWRLFVTLVRFDPVYVGHFKCNLRRIVDYPNLWGYTRDLYQQPGVAETVNLDHIKRHYYVTHPSINPTRVVPLGPVVDFDEPHGRS
ncbi:glutathione S-transferase family protein [Patulibacter brassicae]|uniref:Glutathione S-transferase family protein n=1 Tax=Patulibacter brassicae TaxID=1705717 RepID=A0ABU4VFP3_9ACTN|nr:glutathione S-transferase family protein [Patulibacter brassicae]MDX8150524.1 glutathione S-transferase family protein [Patulibacter brassicae]